MPPSLDHRGSAPPSSETRARRAGRGIGPHPDLAPASPVRGETSHRPSGDGAAAVPSFAAIRTNDLGRCPSRWRRRPGRPCATAGPRPSRTSPPTSPGSPCRTSVPARARSRCAASRPARSCATSRGSRSRPASTSTSPSSRCRCSPPTSTYSTCRGSRCCAARREPCSGRARCRARCATSPTSRPSGHRGNGRARLQLARRRRARQRRELAVNVPLGSAAALRVAAYNTAIGDFIEAVQPDLAVRENVDDGRRTGARVAVLLQPSERLSFTPRLVYQDVSMNGWNRMDAYNILGNPFTTTRPAVSLEDRQQFTQIDEPYTDRFVLGDLTAEIDFGDVVLTQITSVIHRDVEVVRDASALGASVSFSPVRRAGGGLHPRLSPRRRHHRRGADAGNPPRGRGRAAGLGVRLLLRLFRAPVRAERVREGLRGRQRPRRHRLPAGGDGHPGPRLVGVPPAGRPSRHRGAVLLRSRLRLRAARLLRRGDGGRHRPAQPDRRPPLVRLRRGAQPGVRRALRRPPRQHGDHVGERRRAANHRQLRRDRRDARTRSVELRGGRSSRPSSATAARSTPRASTWTSATCRRPSPPRTCSSRIIFKRARGAQRRRRAGAGHAAHHVL